MKAARAAIMSAALRPEKVPAVAVGAWGAARRGSDALAAWSWVPPGRGSGSAAEAAAETAQAKKTAATMAAARRGSLKLESVRKAQTRYKVSEPLSGQPGGGPWVRQ
ncbi:MAG TPA: hypothetical protein DHK64_14160 [Rhodobiaceae bacterium]|nr:hypothetical protein [Rhodobiaceae bacterium]